MSHQFWDVWCRKADGNPHKTAVFCAERTYTHQDIIESAQVLGEDLARRIRAPRARVLLSSANPMAVLLHIFGCWSAGHVPVLVRERLPTAAVLGIAEAASAALLWHEEEYVDLSSRWPTGVPASERESLVLTTSGTTGVPKLVALPDTSQTLNSDAVARDLALVPADRVLVAQPMSHVYGLVGGCLTALWAGAEAHLFDARTPIPHLLRHMRAADITVIQGAPAFWRFLLQYWNRDPFPAVRMWTMASETPGRELIQSVHELFPSAAGLLGYGMTEAGPRVSHVDIYDARVDEGGIGRPFPLIQTRIAPLLDAPQLQEGRLALKGPSMFLGYLGASGGYTGYDADGYFVSTDVVRCDDSGFLYYRGRSDARVKVAGHLISPMALEQFFLSQPGVMNARAFADPHPIMGFVLKVEVVLKAGVAENADALLEVCRQQLDPSLVPRQVLFRNEVSLNSAGKKMRTA